MKSFLDRGQPGELQTFSRRKSECALSPLKKVVLSIALLIGMVGGFPAMSKATDLTAITSPAALTMGDGVTYTQENIFLVFSEYECVLKFNIAPAGSYFTEWGGQAFFLQSDSTDHVQISTNPLARYAKWDISTPFGFKLNAGAQDGSDNWAHFVAGDQYVWAQFTMPTDANDPVTCVTYVYSKKENFSLADAVAAKEAGTINYWQGASGNWTTSQDWILGTPNQNTDPAAVNNGGTVTVSSHVQAPHLYVGRTGSGTVNVAGSGAKLATAYLQVADAGIGTVNVSDAATVEGFVTSIGTKPNASGQVKITGGSSALTTVDLIVGESGSGQVIIEDAGTLTSSTEAFIGKNSGSNGTVTVAGEESIAEFEKLTVGEAGTGSVTVSDGASLTATSDVIIGRAANSHGEITITGENSSAEFESIVVGNGGAGKLAILDGSTVSVGDASGDFVVGAVGFGEVIIDGVGSALTSSVDATIGTSGGNGTITLKNGGSLVTSNINLALGYDASGTLNIGSYDLNHASTAGSTTASYITFFVRDGNQPTLNFNQYDTTTISSVLSARGTINQRGIGTTILTGDNSGYYGTTNVTNGTLHVKNSLGGHTIVSGGTLIAEGQFENVSLNEGSTLIVGDGTGNPALMTVTGELVFDRVVQMQLFIQGTGVGEYSQIFANTIGDGTFHDTIILLDLRFVAGFIPELNDSFQIFTGALPNSDTVAIDLQQPLPEGLYWNTTNLSVDGTVFITNTQAVPEPGTYALLGLGAVFGIWAYRRRAEASV